MPNKIATQSQNAKGAVKSPRSPKAEKPKKTKAVAEPTFKLSDIISNLQPKKAKSSYMFFTTLRFKEVMESKPEKMDVVELTK